MTLKTCCWLYDNLSLEIPYIDVSRYMKDATFQYISVISCSPVLWISLCRGYYATKLCEEIWAHKSVEINVQQKLWNKTNEIRKENAFLVIIFLLKCGQGSYTILF